KSDRDGRSVVHAAAKKLPDMKTWHDKEEFKARVREWANKLNVKARSLAVRPMRRKWASCSTAGNLNFNSDLLALDRELGDYVIVHELLHFSVPNHGKLWKSLMRAHLGDYERIEARLRRAAASTVRFSDEAEGGVRLPARRSAKNDVHQVRYCPCIVQHAQRARRARAAHAVCDQAGRRAHRHRHAGRGVQRVPGPAFMAERATVRSLRLALAAVVRHRGQRGWHAAAAFHAQRDNYFHRGRAERSV